MGSSLERGTWTAGMSHVMDNQLTILKRDARGRVRSTAEARAVAVAEYRRSGLSASAFAQMAGISKNTFWNWLHSHGLTQKRGPSPSKSGSQAQRHRAMRRLCRLSLFCEPQRRPRAGPMRGASSAKPQRAHRSKEDGCFCRSSISTASKNNCARPKPDRSKGKPCEPARAA
jgi:transposase-like protein